MNSRAELNGQIGLLATEKQPLQSKKAQVAAEDKAEPILRLRDRSEAPLSLAQERLWFLQQLDPERVVNHCPCHLRIKGPLNVHALEQALDGVVQRHEVLRTCFPSLAGRPVARVAPHRPLVLEQVDLSGLPPGERESEARRLALAEARQAFDLERGPLVRVRLVRLGSEDHLLLRTMHHIVFDDWSDEVLTRELAALYEAWSTDTPPFLPELPVQYGDYAAWQRERLAGPELVLQLAYWRNQLDGAPALLKLPTDRSRRSSRSPRGARQVIFLGDGLVQQLRQLGRHEGANLFMTLLAGLKALLARYSGQEDIVVGCPVAGRTQRELEGVVGLFVNTLALRTDLSGLPTFRQLLGRVRDEAVAGYAHQEVPFEKLVEELRPARSLGHAPIFQVLFQLRDLSQASSRHAGLSVEPFEVDLGVAPFDLSFDFSETAAGLIGKVDYDAAMFEAGTVERLLGHFQVLLEGAVADPDRAVAHVPLLTDVERRQVLVEWNATAVEYPRERCVHHLFEDQVSRTPDAVALVSGECTLTYGELNVQANRLAHHLRSVGIDRGAVVGIGLRRSPDMIAALLAVLKAGGAYLPLDLKSPPSRQAWMLRDADVKVLLTETALSGRFPHDRARIVCLDNEGSLLTRQRTDDLSRSTTADDLIYLMYTSGSTGRPKGVEVRHRSVVRLVVGADYVRFGPDEVFLQLAPASFDASTFEIWGALLHGARLVLAPEGVPDLAQLEEVLKRHGVTTLWLTAGLFNVLIEQRVEALAGIRQLVTGGEALSVKHVRWALDRLPAKTRLINGYGPTESTTFACCHEISRDLSERAPSVPIGRPIANTRAYVLDRHLQAVPVGVPGEWYLAGDGLARGYLNLPELTAKRFLPDPFRPESRLFRTGDQVRWRPDGTLEYLGRLDQQVKLRGFRVEPGEIEHALAQHAGVAQAVASVESRADTPGDQRLVAHVVLREAAAVSAAELRRHLHGRLPEYMVPSAFVFLKALALTPSGKIDRHALSAPESEQTGDYAAPRDPIEEALVGAWQEVLGRARVGIHDDFFALGGHSLLAVRLFAKIEAAVGRKLPLSTLFEGPTIAQLARILRGPDARLRTSFLSIQPHGPRPRLYFLPSVTGETLYSRSMLPYLLPDQPVYGIQPATAGDAAPSFVPLEKIAADYVDDLCAFQPLGPYCLAGYSFGGTVAFEMARQLVSRGKQVKLVAIIDVGPGRKMEKSALGLLQTAWGFSRNLAWWLRDDLLGTPPKKLLARARRWIHTMLSRRGGRWRSGSSADWRPTAEDFFDVGHLTNHSRQQLEMNLRAFFDYVPGPYPGRVTLLQARTQPLFASHSRDQGWGKWAEGGVEVRTIPGNHESILREPYVRHLAESLQETLTQSG